MDAEQVMNMLEAVLDAKLNPLREDMNDMKQDMAGLKQDVGDMKLDITGLKQDVGDMKLDITGLKQDVGDMKLEIGGIKEELSLIKHDVNQLNNKLDLLAQEQPEDALAMLNIMNGKLDSLHKDIEFTYIKTSKNELEINRLKTQ